MGKLLNGIAKVGKAMAEGNKLLSPGKHHNHIELDREAEKERTKAGMIAEELCRKETDPEKQLEMRARIHVGIYDFSDLV